MNTNTSFRRSVLRLAIPVALQSMLQASFGAVDQIMIGQLGSVSVAGVGLAGKFSSVASVIVAAVGSAAGIMISQYLGQKNAAAVRRSFFTNLLLALGIAGLFTALCVLLPGPVMGLYTRDAATARAAADYLAIVSVSFLPMAGATLLSTLFRCLERPALPLLAGIASAVLNTALNALLIFGKWGLAPMGARGAAVATAIAQLANLMLMLLMLRALSRRTPGAGARPERAAIRFDWRAYAAMLLPLLICEVVWSLGENVYAAIYGHMGTASSAAMTLLNPIQGIMIGALCGLTQAAGVLVGKRLELRRSPGPDRRIRPQMAGSLGLFPPLPGGMRPLRHFDARVSPKKVDAAPGGPSRRGHVSRPVRAANRSLPRPAQPPLALPRAGQGRSINKKGRAAQNVRPSLSDTGKNARQI